MSRSLLSIAVFTIVAFVGCASYDARLTSTKTQYLGQNGSAFSRSSSSTLAEKNSYWDGDGVSGAPSVIISISNQTASFYKGSKLVGVSAISSGREGHDTPIGNYKIMEKDPHHASNLYGDYVDASGTAVVKNVTFGTDPMPPGTHFSGSPMPNFMRVSAAGVGMHQGFLPGVPDSHGCIRMPERMAKIFYENVALGTPVQIVN